MNSLSWFIYIASVAPGLATIIGSFGFVSAFVLFACSLLSFLGAKDNLDDYTKKYRPEKYGRAKKVLDERLWLPSKKLVFASIFAIILATLIPTKETLYLIAGSEATEYVVTSEEGQEILGDIKDVIKHQLNTLKGETK